MPDAQSVTAAAAPSAAPSEEPPDPPQSPWMLAAVEILRNQRVQIQFEVWTSAQHAEPIGHVPVGPTDVHAAMQDFHQGHHAILLSSGSSG